MNGHYDEDTLYEFLDDPDAFVERRELEAHVELCATCRRKLEELKEFEAALSSTALWDFAEAVRRQRSTPDPMRTLADTLSGEDAQAAQLLTPILTSPAAFRKANVAGEPLMHTAGVVRHLCTVARELRERQPMHALSLADSAIAISAQLDTMRYPAALLSDLRGTAWLERANVLRYLGRYPEALDALDISERAYSETPVAVYSIAVVQYVRAVVLFKNESFNEAMGLARQCARVFRQFGEDERYIHAKMIQAGILFHEDRLQEALELFLALTRTARKLGNPETLARLYANVANCQLNLGDLSAASEHFAQALSLYEALGLETERVRTRWSLGRLLLRSGDVREGVLRLHQARREFENLGATTDAALVTLDIVEALLATGDARQARELCHGLVGSFTEVGMTGNALTALAFLNEAVAAGSATPDLVRHIRAFLEPGSLHAERPFEPPI